MTEIKAKDFEEDIDEDDINDDEDTENIYQQYMTGQRDSFGKTTVENLNWQVADDGTGEENELLIFSDALTQYVRKHMGKRCNLANVDYCDIYEDKWSSHKSGKELYYSDLLKIAHGSGISSFSCNDEMTTVHSSEKATNPKQTNRHLKQPANDTLPSGKWSTASNGIGPLEELFVGIVNDTTQNDNGDIHSQLPNTKFRDTLTRCSSCSEVVGTTIQLVPMAKRKLPESFWREPGGSNVSVVNISSSKRKQCKLKSDETTEPFFQVSEQTYHADQSTPDFSDLLNSWTPEKNGQTSQDLNPEERNQEVF